MLDPLISACLIVRNEEQNLPRCLTSVRGLADEIILHDTGSTDRTVEIAREFGARIDASPWRDDFAYHRNRSLSLATGRYSLVLDADEEVVQTDVAVTREKLEHADLPAVLLVRVGLEYPGRRMLGFLSPRLLRTSAGIRYREPIHEQLDLDDEPAALSNISLHHHGYAHAAALVAKEQRNLRIAEAMEASPHSLHCIVRAAFSLRQWEKVVAVARLLIDGRAPSALKAEACALAVAASVNLRNGPCMAEFVAYGAAVAPGSPDTRLAAVVSALGQYLHTLRQRDRPLEALLRPPIFHHDAERAEDMLRALVSGSRAEATETGARPNGGADECESSEQACRG